MKQSFISGALYFGWAQKEEIEHRRVVERRSSTFWKFSPLEKRSSAFYPMG
jgi:hypothetical protein